MFNAFGLKTDARIAEWNKFLKHDNLKYWTNHFRKHPPTITAVKAAKDLPERKTSVYVYNWFPDKLREFGINFIIASDGSVTVTGFNTKNAAFIGVAAPPAKEVAQWTVTEKFIVVVKRAADLLPADVGEELLALIDPLVVAGAMAVVAVWA